MCLILIIHKKLIISLVVSSEMFDVMFFPLMQFPLTFCSKFDGTMLTVKSDTFVNYFYMSCCGCLASCVITMLTFHLDSIMNTSLMLHQISLAGGLKWTSTAGILDSQVLRLPMTIKIPHKHPAVITFESLCFIFMNSLDMII